jgi:BirA family transcriptional regulator, biotin operon repressor / biotin---[acetyl-CoA-carboxylase] ligase
LASSPCHSRSLPALVVAISRSLERMSHDSLAETVAGLPAGWSGRFAPRVTSTQDVARAAAQAGAPSRWLVVADEQTAGRGRHGRGWLAEPGSGLLVSIVFRERAPIAWRYTSLTALALAEAIEQVAPDARVAIKWPNDLLLDGRKLAGVLAESSWDGEQLLLIVGLGVNVGSAPENLPATCLQAATGREVDRGQLLRGLVGRLDVWLGRSPEETQAAWQARLWGRGQRVRLTDLEADEFVIVLGVEPDGRLRVRLADGSERATTTGELLL